MKTTAGVAVIGGVLLAFVLGLAITDARATGINPGRGASSAISALPSTAIGRTQYVWRQSAPTVGTFDITSAGGFLATSYGGGTKGASFLNTRQVLVFNMPGTAGTTNGYITAAQVVRRGTFPKASAFVRVTQTASMMHFIGFDDNTGTCNIGAGATQFTLAATYACGSQHMAVVQDFRAGSNPNSWHCCSGDGGNGSCTVMGAVPSGTDSFVTVDATTSQLVCTVSDATSGATLLSASKSTNLPSISAHLKFNLVFMDTAAVAVTTQPLVGGVTIETSN
jgi:hypothetical protein